jgi:hypothetical protein
MKISRLVVPLLVVLVLTLSTVSAFAGDFAVKNWRVYNVKPATASYWDINKAHETSGSLTFPIQRFESKTTGSFAVYFLANYNVDLTGKTMYADASWTAGTYETRGDCLGAYARFEFQDTTAGFYDSNDYWWAPAGLDLNNATSGEITASLDDRSQWINQSGKSALNRTEDWQQWQGDIVHMSPYDGFTKAMKNVKQMGLSFGNGCSYASGVAMKDGTGTFTVNSFTIQ